MSNGKKGFLRFVGNVLVQALPMVIKSLSVIGTIALLLVAGGIFVHNIEFLHHFLETWPGFIRDFIVGLCVGIIALILFKIIKGFFKLIKKGKS